MDRCDTPAYWFLLSVCGRPFFACPDLLPFHGLVKQERRRWSRRGATLERREGNYAAATLEELRHCWPGSSSHVTDHGVIFVSPDEVVPAENVTERAA